MHDLIKTVASKSKRKMLSIERGLLILPTLVLLSSNFWLLGHGASLFHHLQYKQLNGTVNESTANEFHILLRGAERLLLEGGENDNAANSTIILAASKTHRRDPLDDFNYYTGGWNYTNAHYWASVSFSGAPLFITAIVWFLLVGLSLCIACICCCCCCCSSKSYGYSETAHAFTLTLLIFFTIAAVVGCGFLYENQENFNESVVDALRYIMKRGLAIFDHLMTVWEALASAKNVSVNHVSLPVELRDSIDAADKMIKDYANMTQFQSLASKKSIQSVLNPARLALNILAGLMLAIAIIGFLCSIFGLQCLMYITVIIGWILVTVVFILCGVFLIFHNVVADTCVAMDEFLQLRTANSALDLQFLPCLDNATAQAALNTTIITTKSLIAIDNQYITNVANNNDLPPDARPLYYNQSGPPVPILCDPFSDDLTDRKCGSAEVDFTDGRQEWEKHICEASEDGVCTSVGRLTPAMYNQLTIPLNISSSLYRSGEFLVSLANCSFVIDTFNEISKNHCPDLRTYSFWTFVGLLVATASVMFSVVFWICYSRESRKRRKSYRGIM